MRAGVRNPRSTDDSWLIRLLIEALIVAGAPGVGSDQLPAKVRPTPARSPTNLPTRRTPRALLVVRVEGRVRASRSASYWLMNQRGTVAICDDEQW